MRLLLLSFVLLASTMVNAQSFRVGPTVRALYTSPTDDARSGWGVEAGVTGEMNFNKDCLSMLLCSLIILTGNQELIIWWIQRLRANMIIPHIILPYLLTLDIACD